MWAGCDLKQQFEAIPMDSLDALLLCLKSKDCFTTAGVS